MQAGICIAGHNQRNGIFENPFARNPGVSAPSPPSWAFPAASPGHTLPCMTSTPRFIHLRVHSEYSLLEGAVRLKKLPGLCRDARMPAVAVTDTNNMFAALEFSVAAQNEGIQPIMGCQIDLSYASAAPGDRQTPPAPVVLLAQNEQGYRNLMKLNSRFYLRGDGQAGHVTMDELAQRGDGLICLTGGPDGPVGRLLRAGQRAAAEALLSQLSGAFG